jgi:hypothetical protein
MLLWRSLALPWQLGKLTLHHWLRVPCTNSILRLTVNFHDTSQILMLYVDTSSGARGQYEQRRTQCRLSFVWTTWNFGIQSLCHRPPQASHLTDLPILALADDITCKLIYYLQIDSSASKYSNHVAEADLYMKYPVYL